MDLLQVVYVPVWSDEQWQWVEDLWHIDGSQLQLIRKVHTLMLAAFCAWVCSSVISLLCSGMPRAISVSAGELSLDNVHLEGKGLGVVLMGARLKAYCFLIEVAVMVAVQRLKLRV
jgi:hypothetical protein